MTLKLGLIGAGKIAVKYLEVLAAVPDVEIAAIANRSNPVIHDLASRFAIPKVFNDSRALLDSGVDAVIVAPSVIANFEVSQVCLEQGMPCLLEKPPGLTVAEAEALANLAAKKSVPHLVALNRRYYSSVRQAREAIAEKGRLIAVAVEAPEKLEHTRAHPPAIAARWMVANGIHCLDLFRHLGGEVEQVHAVSHVGGPSAPSSFAALVRFAGGLAGQFTSHWAAPGPWTVTLYGEGRRVTLKPIEKCNVLDADGTERALEPDPIDVKFKPGLYRQLEAFLAVVRSRGAVAAPGADLAEAVKTMRLIAQIGGTE
ncbi:MAG: Gfo/Idh/MocA family oxidoreductase [Myxococcaceae bacterium]|nr:Gfo/Idh/MocA family oxidoreductase [Myxococcaceae bacterium]